MINDIPHKDLQDQKAEGNEGRPSDFIGNGAPKKKFKNTAFGRTILLKNRTGKTIIGVLAAAGTSTLLPPPIGNIVNGTINLLIPNLSTMDALTDMSLIQILITVGAFLIITGVPMLFKGVRDSVIWQAVKGRIDAIADELVEAVDKDSEGGKKITKEEVQEIIQAAIKPKE